jgi:plasmid stabilization system protein ParE
MSHRLAPEAEAELDDIWYYLATERGAISPALDLAPFFSADLL